jgi:hypothetical protein
MPINLYPHKIFITIFVFLSFIVATIPALADIYLSKEQVKGVPMKQPSTTFHCGDKIYGVITGKWPAGSEHLLEAYWTDPQGKQREHTRYRFIARKGETRTWAWLRLHPAEPDILERLLMQEDDSLREFNGQWKVVFYVDRKNIGTLRFQVTCG